MEQISINQDKNAFDKTEDILSSTENVVDKNLKETLGEKGYAQVKAVSILTGLALMGMGLTSQFMDKGNEPVRQFDNQKYEQTLQQKEQAEGSVMHASTPTMMETAIIPEPAAMTAEVVAPTPEPIPNEAMPTVEKTATIDTAAVSTGTPTIKP